MRCFTWNILSYPHFLFFSPAFPACFFTLLRLVYDHSGDMRRDSTYIRMLPHIEWRSVCLLIPTFFARLRSWRAYRRSLLANSFMWTTSHYIAKLIPLFGLETVVFTTYRFGKPDLCGQLELSLRYRHGIEQDSPIRLIASRMYWPHRTGAASWISFRTVTGAYRARITHRSPLS